MITFTLPSYFFWYFTLYKWWAFPLTRWIYFIISFNYIQKLLIKNIPFNNYMTLSLTFFMPSPSHFLLNDLHPFMIGWPLTFWFLFPPTGTFPQSSGAWQHSQSHDVDHLPMVSKIYSLNIQISTFFFSKWHHTVSIRFSFSDNDLLWTISMDIWIHFVK